MMKTEGKIRRLIAESHKRQFYGEDYQAVAIDIAESNDIARRLPCLPMAGEAP